MVAKVSVIIPVYNAEKYLEECLDSVLGQTLKEIEVICIDDGSTDNSLKILQEYERRDERLIVLSHTNQGAGHARNKGIQIASGEYIAFMDSDDFYPDQNVLNLLYSKAVAHRVSICGGSLLFFIQGNILPAISNENIKYYFEKEGIIKYKDFQQDYYYQRFIYKKDFLIEQNISFPLYLRHQDPPFFIRAMVIAEEFYAVVQDVYAYRSGDTQINWTSRKMIDMFSGIIDDLSLSSKYKLEQLHFRVANRINRIFGYTIRKSPIYKESQTLILMARLYQAIDMDLIKPKSVDLSFLHEYFNGFGLEADSIKIGEKMNKSVRSVKVSVIIPVYNVEDYLQECLDSICGQTLRDIEIICINDGSTDDSLRILEKFAAEDKRITIVSQRNKGLSGARNTGVLFATGEYIYFIDSDDYIDKTALEYLYKEAKKDALDILYFDGISFSESQNLKTKYPGEDCCYREKEYSDIYTGADLYVAMRRDGVFRPMVWLQFISKAFYENKHLAFREGIIHEDVLFSYISVLKAQRVSHRRKVFYHYRRREGTITSAYSFKHVYGKLVCLIEISSFMKSQVFDRNVIQLMGSYLQWLQGDMKTQYGHLSEEEKNKVVTLLPEERVAMHYYLGEIKDFFRIFEGGDEMRQPRVIVSMTSYSGRIETVHLALQSILNQTQKADKVILYLSAGQFLHKENDLPKELIDCVGQGVEIKWCKNDLKSHKKYFYAMQEYPNDIIITVDDDLLYKKDMVEMLMDSYKKHPYAVSAMRTHLIRFDEDGNILPYKDWIKEIRTFVDIPSMRLFATSGAGTLYPPYCMSIEVFNMEAIMNMCLKADDIWLKIMQVAANTPVILVTDSNYLKYIPGTQEVTLYQVNGLQGQNDIQLKKVMEFYKNIRLSNGLSIKERLYIGTELLESSSQNDDKMNSECNRLKNDLSRIQYDFQCMRESVSFRVGRIITWGPRKIRGLLRCLADHGLVYTCRRIIEHCGIDMGTGDKR